MSTPSSWWGLQSPGDGGTQSWAARRPEVRIITLLIHFLCHPCSLLVIMPILLGMSRDLRLQQQDTSVPWASHGSPDLSRAVCAGSGWSIWSSPPGTDCSSSANNFSCTSFILAMLMQYLCCPIWRRGVEDGQIPYVVEHEVKAIKVRQSWSDFVCSTRYSCSQECFSEAYADLIIQVIVSKRINTMFFKTGSQPMSRAWLTPLATTWWRKPAASSPSTSRSWRTSWPSSTITGPALPMFPAATWKIFSTSSWYLERLNGTFHEVFLLYTSTCSDGSLNHCKL